MTTKAYLSPVKFKNGKTKSYFVLEKENPPTKRIIPLEARRKPRKPRKPVDPYNPKNIPKPLNAPSSRTMRNRRRRIRRKEKRQQARVTAQLPPPNFSVLEGHGDYKEKKKKNKKEEKQVEKDWFDRVLDIGETALPHLLPLLAGLGDYKEADPDINQGALPSSNSIVSAATDGEIGGEVPNMHKTGESVRIAHREYLGDVYSSTASFTPVTFPLNPGMNETCPWLSLIAAQFQEYRFLGLCAEFVSEGSEYANVAGLGYVALGTQYNALAPAFADKKTMLNYEYTTSTKPSKSMIHCIECKPEMLVSAEKFVRSGSITAGDLRLYDLGNLTLAVGGNTASGSIIGELWLTYDVEFYIPKSTESVGLVAQFCYYSTVTGVANGTMMGTLGSGTYFSTATFQPTIGGNVLTFPSNVRGTFLIEFVWSNQSVTYTQPTVTYGNCSAPSSGIFPYTVTTVPQTGMVAVTQVSIKVPVVVTQDNATITLSAGAIPQSVFSAFIVQYPSASNASPIFDKKGRNESTYYANFMKKFMNTKSLAVALNKQKEYFPSEIGSDYWSTDVVTDNYTVQTSVSNKNEHTFFENDEPETLYPLKQTVYSVIVDFRCDDPDVPLLIDGMLDVLIS